MDQGGYDKTGDEQISTPFEIDPTRDHDHNYPRGPKLVFIVVALVLSVFLSSLDIVRSDPAKRIEGKTRDLLTIQTIVATAMPKITDESGGLGKQSWYGSAFFITTGSAQSAWGKAYKYFDLKWTFLLSICIFEIGSLVCGVAPNADTLIFGRALAGIGCAGLSTGGYTIIAFIAPPAKRPLYTGFVGSSFGVASVLGPLLGES